MYFTLKVNTLTEYFKDFCDKKGIQTSPYQLTNPSLHLIHLKLLFGLIISERKLQESNSKHK